LEIGEVEHAKLLAKTILVEGAWWFTFEKLKMCQRHKSALSTQVHSMKSRYQQPTLIPFPLPFLCLVNVDCGKFSRDVSISACPFCHRRFDPA
jgi:hypothetical protein